MTFTLYIIRLSFQTFVILLSTILALFTQYISIKIVRFTVLLYTIPTKNVNHFLFNFIFIINAIHTIQSNATLHSKKVLANSKTLFTNTFYPPYY